MVCIGVPVFVLHLNAQHLNSLFLRHTALHDPLVCLAGLHVFCGGFINGNVYSISSHVDTTLYPGIHIVPNVFVRHFFRILVQFCQGRCFFLVRQVLVGFALDHALGLVDHDFSVLAVPPSGVRQRQLPLDSLFSFSVHNLVRRIGARHHAVSNGMIEPQILVPHRIIRDTAVVPQIRIDSIRQFTLAHVTQQRL